MNKNTETLFVNEIQSQCYSYLMEFIRDQLDDIITNVEDENGITISESEKESLFGRLECEFMVK